MAPLILITSKPTPEDREIMGELGAPLGQVRFLADLPEEQRPAAADKAAVILTFNPLKELGQLLARLHPGQLLQVTAAGLDHLPFASLPQGLTVAGNSGAYGLPMAEHALAMVLCLAKRLREEDAAMRRGEFNQMTPNLLLSGKKAAVLGFGGAGKAAARLLRALGMRVFAMNTSGKTDEPVEYVGTTADLQTILDQAQVLIVTLPYTKLTKDLIGARELSWLAKDAILANVARGEVIDQKALYEHLLAHPQFKAGLESWWVEPLRHGRFALEYPLLTLPNLLACPHNSFNVPEWRRLGLTAAFANIQRFFAGEPLTGLMRPETHEV